MGALFLALVLLLVICSIAWGASAKAAKKRNQEVKRRGATVQASGGSSATVPTAANDDLPTEMESSIGSNDIFIDLSGEAASQEMTCPPCPARTYKMELAVAQFWSHDVATSYACVCNILQANPNDQLARALLTTLRATRQIDRDAWTDIAGPTKDAKKLLSSWELLGPLNIGKLELDGDPTFASDDFARHQGDVGSFLLAMRSNATVHSDLVTESRVSWQQVSAKNTGQVDVHFQAAWNDLVQGLSNTGVYEVQAWVRTTTFVKTAGLYLLDCQGPHTVYVRNDNLTRILVGDVYRAQQVRATVDLKAGLVGIAMPVRAVLQTSFRCELSRAPDSLLVFPPQDVPQLLEFPSAPDHGYLLSSLFQVVVHNPFSQAVTIGYSLEKPSNGWTIREAALSSDPNAAPRHSSVSAGQTMALTMELLQLEHPTGSPSPPLLPCRSRPLQLIFTPSKGSALKVPLDLVCRKITQSFHLSYLDHDHSLAQAAVVLPLEFHSPAFAHAVKSYRAASAGTGVQKKARGSRSQKTADPSPTRGGDGDEETQAPEIGAVLSTEQAHQEVGFPVLLSLHGSGIAALSHADAHKLMLPESSDYLFGVAGFYLLAPTRFGAHNWEGTGHNSAVSALAALQRLTLQYPALLPKLHAEHSLISGHSMGGHGAWITAVNAPDRFLCAAPASGWIKKEEYSNGNAFFDLDVATSFTDPGLKAVLEASWAEFHVDRHASNLKGSAVHIRVGSHDLTTHPWYSRRMHRILTSAGVNSTIEESAAKQHWWWDTVVANDGGVLNDDVLRGFYATCHDRFVQAVNLQRRHQDFLQATRPVGGGMESSSVSFLEHLTQKYVEVARSKEAAATSKERVQGLVAAKRCQGRMELSVVNPALHKGLCGAQVLQQHRPFAMATVVMSMDKSGKECQIVTGNVRRMTLHFNFEGVCYDTSVLVVNGKRLSVRGGSKTAEICVGADRQPALCHAPLEPLTEKTLATYGPIRHTYHRPFAIIYGTPRDQRMRVAMRDLAIYMANAHYAAHHTFVPVFSDLEFRAAAYYKSASLSNYVFIGDEHTNKVLKLIRSQETQLPAKKVLPFEVTLPGDLVFHGFKAADDRADEAEAFEVPSEARTGFSILNATFDRSDHALVFTFPILRTAAPGAPSGASLAICLSANTAEGYLHLSRLSWPVIPPMVRAPLAGNLPDYLVVDREIWAKGPGGIVAAGFWDSEWKFDATNSYMSTLLV